MFRLANLFFLICILFLLVTPIPAKAQSSSCQPGTVCSFPLAGQGTACRFNENLFFGKTDRWEFGPQGFDYFNFRFGPFTTNGGGYQKAGTIEGGCICDVATWLNYVLKINGFITAPSAKWHTAYAIKGVPDEIDTDGKSLYFVSIEHKNPKPSPGPNGEPVKWDADMRVENPNNETVAIRWQITGDNVTIWVEKSAEPIPELAIEVADPSVKTANTSDVSFSQLPAVSKLFLALLAGTTTVFLLGFFFSKKFRSGTVTVLLVLTPLVLLVIYLLPR